MSMISQNVQNYPVIPAPYLPPLPAEKKHTTFTLVLDLDETLVHYANVSIIIINI
jgi:predicted enzyme involved in methoxymalonyl-ACP biosynthesis